MHEQENAPLSFLCKTLETKCTAHSRHGLSTCSTVLHQTLLTLLTPQLLQNECSSPSPSPSRCPCPCCQKKKKEEEEDGAGRSHVFRQNIASSGMLLSKGHSRSEDSQEI